MWSVTVFVPATSYPPPTIRVRAFLDFPSLSKSWSTWSNLEANFPDCDVHCVYCERPLDTNDWNFLPCCFHMNSHHALSTHVTGESSAHHTKPLSTPTPPLSSLELSLVPRNRVTAPAIYVKHSAALLHHPPCNLQGKSTTHTDLESQHEQTWGFLWKINKSNGLSKRMERLSRETSEFLICTKQSDSWTGSSTLV